MKTIAEMKKNPTDNKKVLLRVKVIKQIKESIFIIADSSDCALLSIEGNERWSKVVQVENFLQLIKPKILSNYIILTTTPLPIDSFKLSHKSKKCCESLEKLALTERVNETEKLKSLQLLTNIDMLPAKTNIVNLLLKVTNMSRESTGKFTSFRHISVKDESGDKSTVTLFGYYRNMVKEGDVYHFQNLQTSDYKGPMDIYKRLNSSASTKIRAASDDEKNLFGKILIGDGIVTGNILLVDEVYQYSSCKYCWSKIQDMEMCFKCKRKLGSNDKINDYNYILHVETEEEIKTLFGFRRHFNTEDNEEKSKEELETALNSEYKGKHVIVDYLNDGEDMDKFRILKIEFTN